MQVRSTAFDESAKHTSMNTFHSQVTRCTRRTCTVCCEHFVCMKGGRGYLRSLEVPVDEVERDGSRLFRLLKVFAKHRLHRFCCFHDVIVRHLVGNHGDTAPTIGLNSCRSGNRRLD